MTEPKKIISFRLPPKLIDKLKGQAVKQNKSLTKVVVEKLER